MKLGFPKKKKLSKKRVKEKLNKICIFSDELIDRIHNIENNKDVEIYDTTDELFKKLEI